MLVKELVEALNTYDQDVEVMIQYFSSINGVKIASSVEDTELSIVVKDGEFTSHPAVWINGKSKDNKG